MRQVTQAIWSAGKGVVRALYETYRLGGRTLLVAPIIVAIAVIPEFAQHVVEINLGMFDSREAAHALADSPLRWGFGYVKLAGFAFAILLTARLWAFDGSVRRALRIPPRVLLRTGFALAVMIAVSAALAWLSGRFPPIPREAISIVGDIVSAGVMVWAIAELVEDRSMSLWRAVTLYLPTAVLVLLLFFAAMLPAQALHGVNHKVALGQSAALIWPLMLFDSLVVGVIAALAGAAIHVGFRAGPTWRGWTRPPGSRT
ncbi:hypothetical protein E5A73_08260 [Sphingomonas gei]|uniref:Uncharacterized protein n=1 Tax=Sphingomonas gei TaxID=1395960 RepID=A0A4S1XGG6_9SPHN|nr:hypothetical protein [Sphingomonas gei]TGX54106.1 hypothetical protein E5A73_08260 [Sphingomonas gei]